MPRISPPGNRRGQEASVLIDAVFAIFILCLGIGGAALALGSASRKAGRALASVSVEVSARATQEAKAYDKAP